MISLDTLVHAVRNILCNRLCTLPPRSKAEWLQGLSVLKALFWVGIFCHPVCQWVFVLSHFAISPPSESCSHCWSCSQWQHLKDQMWDVLNDRHDSVAAGGMREKIREIFALFFISSTLWNLALLREIACYVLHSPFQNTQSALSHITSSINPQNSPCVHNLSQRESTAILARCVLARAWSCFKTYIKPTWNQEESVHLSHTAWVH